MGFTFIVIAIAGIIIGVVIWFASKTSTPLTSAEKGKIGELDTVQKLNYNKFWKRSGKILTNIYVPKASGETSEVDAVYITHKGLIVVEDKNYGGYIFGNENNKNWTVTLYEGKKWYGKKSVRKIQFYNPIKQNKTHITNIKNYLGFNVPCFSIVAFCDRGTLKKIEYYSQDVFVCNHAKLTDVLNNIWKNNPDVISDSQIDEIYEKLNPLTSADNAVKSAHISGIHERLNSNAICPVCKGKLVLRVATKGKYAGNQFYGCSNYPKCKYTKNIPT